MELVGIAREDMKMVKIKPDIILFGALEAINEPSLLECLEDFMHVAKINTQSG